MLVESHECTHNKHVVAFYDHVHHPTRDDIAVFIKPWSATKIDFDLDNIL